MLGLERTGVGDTAEKNTGVADPMALFDQALDQGLRFTGALPPYDMVTRLDYPGEIEIA